jgi:MFS family permease
MTRIDAAARRRGLCLSVFEGMSAQAQTSCTGLGAGGPNAITIGFAFLLGARDPALGLLGALPVFGNLGAYVGAALAPRMRGRKRTVAISSTLARVSWLLIGAIPFAFVQRRDLGLAIFLFAWAVTNALMSLSGNLWTSWMADLCPPRIRGRYFSQRTKWTTIAGIVVPLLVSLLLDKGFGGVPSPDAGESSLSERQAYGFALVFGISAVFGLVCYVLLSGQPEPTRAPEAVPPPLDVAWFLEPFRDRRFLALLVFVAAFGATNGIAVPFWTPFMLQEMKLDYSFVNGWFVVLQGTTMAASLPLWGRLTDRIGNRPAMALALCFICSHPFYYVCASSPDRWWLIIGDQLSSGLAWAGYNLAIFNLVLALAPHDRRELYLATNAVVIGVFQASTSVLAGRYIGSLPDHMPFLGLALNPRQQVFLATAVARLGCLGLFLAVVEEPKSRPIRAVVAGAQSYMKSAFAAFKLISRDD